MKTQPGTRLNHSLEIHISRDGEKFGPYTTEEVRDYRAEGSLLGSDLAWHEGLENWVLLEEIVLPAALKRTPPPPSKVPPKAESFNPVSPFFGYGPLGATAFGPSFLNGFIIIPTSLNDDLTRELAADILNGQLAEPRISQLAFIEGGIEKAREEGWVVESPDFSFFGNYTFTDKSFHFLHQLVSEVDQIHRPEDDQAGQARTPFFELASPIGQRVEEVTGITAGPLGTRILIVEYISAYLIPTEMEAIMPYIYTAQRKSTAFQKYDDGWRVVGDL